MNLILLEPADLTGDTTAVLRGRNHRHVREVLRSQTGDCLRVGLLGGKLGNAHLLRAHDDHSEIEVEWAGPPPAPLDVHLYLAMPRPKVLPRLLLTATTLGVKQITLINCVRVEKAYWSCEQIKQESIRAACRLGLEQARDTILPKIHLERRFKPFVEDRLPAQLEGRLALLAHPHADEICPFDVSEPLSLVVGPEGGFIPYELDHLARAGFKSVRTYERILRVDAAVTTLIGRLKG